MGEANGGDNMEGKAIALLREQQGKDKFESVKLMVLERLAESIQLFDPVGTVIDESGELFFYIINKKALLSEFVGSVLECLVITRACAVNGSFALYMAHKAKSIGKFSHEEKQLALERIVNALTVGKGKRFGDDPED